MSKPNDLAAAASRAAEAMERVAEALKPEPFLWEGRSTATIGELLDEACKAERDGKAVEFLREYREHNEHADANLGYIIGYLEPPERRSQMYAAYDLMHPVFGGRP